MKIAIMNRLSPHIQSFESLKMGNTAVEGMRKLHGPMPEEQES